jgi:hypothetical protein
MCYLDDTYCITSSTMLLEELLCQLFFLCRACRWWLNGLLPMIFFSLSSFKIYKLIIFVFLTFQLPHSFFYIFIKKNVITLAYDGDIKRWMLSNYQYNTIISCLTYLNLYQLNSRQDRFLVGPKSGSGDRSIAIA